MHYITKKMKRILTSLTLLIFISCGTTLTGYDFKTNATYIAVKSNFKVHLIAQGHVPAGEDLGKGDLTGLIIFGNSTDTIYFQTHYISLTNINYKGNPPEIIDSANFVKTFSELFEKTGNTDYDSNEMEEIEKIIKATADGPKGTYLNGQTKLIKVEKVEFDR